MIIFILMLDKVGEIENWFVGKKLKIIVKNEKKYK